MASNKILSSSSSSRQESQITFSEWDETQLGRSKRLLKKKLLEFTILQHNSSWEENQIQTYRLFLSGCWENTNIKARGI